MNVTPLGGKTPIPPLQKNFTSEKTQKYSPSVAISCLSQILQKKNLQKAANANDA
jgi:hypothetical protein